MASGLPQPTDCCSSCADPVVSQVPGPKGDAGANGTNGTNGINAFTTTSAQFTMPAVSSAVSVTVATSAWAANGQEVYVTNAGYMTVAGIPDSTHLSLSNLGYPGNAAPTTVIASGQQVSPAGLRGATGSSSTVTLNDISPTTTKGDLIVDNGANSPNASDVRMSVGSDGKAIVANSSQATGLSYATITPNAATDNAVARYDGASGTPVPLQTSKLIVTDNGAAQASGSGGNARGADAIDLQVSRTLATQVASGNTSAIGGGTNNTASGLSAVVSGGDTNIASGPGACVSGGVSNTASADGSCVLGGSSNTASGNKSSVTGGFGNLATGLGSIALNGNQNAALGTNSLVGGGGAQSDKYGQRAWMNNGFVHLGDAQQSDLIWRISTSDATAGVEMFLDGVSSRATVPASTAWVFQILLVATSSSLTTATWKAEGTIKTTSGGTTSLAGAITPVVINDETGGTWGVAGNFAITADNTNKSLKLAVTGAAATGIRWVAHARIVEVNYTS